MLKPAQNYITEIKTKYADTMYDLNYQYYHADRWTSFPSISEDNCWKHQFASVDANNNVIGYISYSINLSAESCDNFTIISFDKGNLTFVRDIQQAVDDIFNKYNFNRLEFQCFVGNTALRGYRNFIKRYGGREVGTLKQVNKLIDGKLYDAVIFEILKEDYKGLSKPKQCKYYTEQEIFGHDVSNKPFNFTISNCTAAGKNIRCHCNGNPNKCTGE